MIEVQNIKKRETRLGKVMRVLYIEKVIKKIKRWIKNIEGRTYRNKYMITPCDHVFHTVCLEKWMALKNECPYCKGVLPSIL